MDEEAQRSVSFRLNRRGDRTNQNTHSKGKEANSTIPHFSKSLKKWVFLVALYFAVE